MKSGENQRVVLSEFSFPQIRNGEALFSPQNLNPGFDRLAYLDNLLSYANNYLATQKESVKRIGINKILQFLIDRPFASALLRLGQKKGKPFFFETPGIREHLSLDRDSISLVILDGRNRRLEDSLILNVGSMVPGASRFFGHLARGSSVEVLKKILKTKNLAILMTFLKS